MVIKQPKFLLPQQGIKKMFKVYEQKEYLKNTVYGYGSRYQNKQIRDWMKRTHSWKDVNRLLALQYHFSLKSWFSFNVIK